MRHRPPCLRAGVAALAGLFLLAVASPAAAATDAEKQAQALFSEAMKLLAGKQYAEACEKLARSQELDPGMGTQFRLAECYEKLGRAASAFVQYNAVAEAAKAAGKADCEALAKRRAAALEPKLARLTITVPPATAALPGLEVRRDGGPVPETLWGTPQAVDPGDHLVTVRAPRKKPWEGKVWAEASAKLTVAVGALEDVAPPPIPPRSRVPAIALGAGGGVAVLLGITFAGLYAGKAASAHSIHDRIVAGGGNCVNGGLPKDAADCAQLASAGTTGDAFATASVVTFVMGGAALAAMGTYLLWPKFFASAPARAGFLLAPAIGAGSAGLGARGSF